MINERLKAIAECYAPLSEHAERYVSLGTRTDADGTIAIGHNPKIAPENFVFTIFPPASQEQIAAPRSYKIPTDYLRFLTVLNGCFAYRMSLFGFGPLFLDRTRLQCHGLATANEFWRMAHQGPERMLFYFGYRNYSLDENADYFMEAGGGVRSFLQSGRELQRWDNFTSFLRDELVAAEAFDKKHKEYFEKLFSGDEEKSQKREKRRKK